MEFRCIICFPWEILTLKEHGRQKMDSIWSKTCKQKKRPALEGDIQTNVAVIGGGQTKNTTAKITSQHGMFCNRFLEKKGEEKARNYVQANQDAVEEYKRILFLRLVFPVSGIGGDCSDNSCGLSVIGERLLFCSGDHPKRKPIQGIPALTVSDQPDKGDYPDRG